MAANGKWVSAKLDAELVSLLKEVTTTSPSIAGRSSFIRYGIKLALRDALERDLISDQELRDRIATYLSESENVISEPIIRIN